MNIEIYNQWMNRPQTAPMSFKEPDCTIPDQSMTIQEIIAKFTRTGLVPQSFVHRDEGGNSAFPPDFDPMDEGRDYLDAAAAASHGSEQAPQEPASEPETPAPKGEGGE